MKTYRQRVHTSDQFFRYEYWWVTHREVVGPRLVKVRIPPLGHICPWEFRLIDMGSEEPIRYEDERDDWIWLDYIQEPDTSLFDNRKKG